MRRDFAVDDCPGRRGGPGRGAGHAGQRGEKWQPEAREAIHPGIVAPPTAVVFVTVALAGIWGFHRDERIARALFYTGQPPQWLGAGGGSWWAR